MEGCDRLFNHVILVGRMTKSPELRYTAEGVAVCNFTLAMNRPFRQSHGEYEADFIQCNIWRKPAENTATYCQKGSLVAVTGRIQSRHYENQEGIRIYVTEVVVDRIRFLDKKIQSSSPEESESAYVDVDSLLDQKA